MITKTTTFQVFDCAKCGVPFALTEEYVQRRRGDRESFYCPNGHSQWFAGESDKDKAQRLAGQLDMERTRARKLAEKLDYSRRATKANGTRLRKLKERAANGVCPCCNRTFRQLAAHMRDKHPDFTHVG